jgi:hypothetical protein
MFRNDVPLRLFELKNGTAAQRERFQAIQSAFTALAPDRTFDIRFQATTLAPLTAVPAEAGRVAGFLAAFRICQGQLQQPITNHGEAQRHGTP